MTDAPTSVYHLTMRTTVTLDDDVYEAAPAGARMIPAARIQKALDEDGLARESTRGF
jgi:hypothetical protein